MEHSIEFGGNPVDVIVTTSGDASPAGFRRMIEDLVTDPRYRPPMRVLVDHTALDTASLTSRRSTRSPRPSPGRGPGSAERGRERRAARRDVRSRAHDRGADGAPLMQSHVFRSRDEARAWLAEQPLDG